MQHLTAPLSSASPPAPARLHPYTFAFFRQLKAILACGEQQQFSSIKGASKGTEVSGRKVFGCDMPLDGFKTYITQRGDSLRFGAQSLSLNDTAPFVSLLLNPALHNDVDFPGYYCRDNATEHFMIAGPDWKQVTMLKNDDKTIKLIVVIREADAGFTLLTQ
jgi:hypothetical protein